MTFEKDTTLMFDVLMARVEYNNIEAPLGLFKNIKNEPFSY